MDALFVSLLVATAGYLGWLKFKQYTIRRDRSAGKKAVPVAAWRLPFAGNGIAFSRDVMGYIRECHAKYGPIFRLKIFRTEMIVVCDEALTGEYFGKKESEMSLYSVLDKLFFTDAFADDRANLDVSIKIIRSTVKVNADIFAPKILEEGRRMVVEMHRDCKWPNPANLQSLVMKFIARTSARCFIDFDMTDEFYDVLLAFSLLLNRIIVLTYFAPKWLLRFVFLGRLKEYRKTMIDAMETTIQAYRDDPAKCDSPTIRYAMDLTVTRPNGSKRMLTNAEIGGVLICLLYVSTENTALGLTSALLDLAKNPEFWGRVRADTCDSLHENDYRALFSDRLLNACVMESARINTHVFAINRQPISDDVLGGYYVGDADCVVLCEPMLMMDCAGDKFTNPMVYNPDRFLESGEKNDAKSVMSWGAGMHLCPGKQFAIMEMKVGMGMITNAFKRFEYSNSRKDYFSPSAFAEFNADVRLVPETKAEHNVSAKFTVHNVGGIIVHRYMTDGHDGWLIHNYLDETRQQELYNYTTKDLVGENHDKFMGTLKGANRINPVPFVFDNLVYTRTSNCPVPNEWYFLAGDVWEMMRGNAGFGTEPKEFNSLCSQLFAVESTLDIHKDQYVDWGVSVSLGSSAEFTFGEHKIKLHSGSIFIADFSKVDHGITRIYPNTCPGWFDLDEEFGRCRLSVQIRDIPGGDALMGETEFRGLINKKT